MKTIMEEYRPEEFDGKFPDNLKGHLDEIRDSSAYYIHLMPVETYHMEIREKS